MANFVYIATSLDGFIATSDGGVDWLMEVPNPDHSDFGFADFFKRVDGVLMGTNSFKKVLSFGSWLYTKPVFVLSNSLKEIPSELEGKASFVRGSLTDVTQALASQGIQNLYIDGGKLIQSFLREDLIDEMIITKVPKLLGEGIPLFGNLDQMMDFTHVETETIHNCLVKSRYLRKRD